MLTAVKRKIVKATADMWPNTSTLQATLPSIQWPTTSATTRSGVDAKQTVRSPTARFSMKILTRFFRNSAQLTIVMMTIALPSNVSNISTETTASRKRTAGVQAVSGPFISRCHVSSDGTDTAVPVMFLSRISSVSKCSDIILSDMICCELSKYTPAVPQKQPTRRRMIWYNSITAVSSSKPGCWSGFEQRKSKSGFFFDKTCGHKEVKSCVFEQFEQILNRQRWKLVTSSKHRRKPDVGLLSDKTTARKSWNPIYDFFTQTPKPGNGKTCLYAAKSQWVNEATESMCSDYYKRLLIRRVTIESVLCLHTIGLILFISCNAGSTVIGCS